MEPSITLYGISNCDTIKKARSWLNEHRVSFEFHDYRKQGLDRDQLQSMTSALGWETMLNRRGTTWRALPETLKNTIDSESALQVMLDNPAIIKRPIMDRQGSFHIGFSPAQYQEIFG